MHKVREMNKEIFKYNLLMTIEEILKQKELDTNQLKFKIVPVKEPNKPLFAQDEQMRLWALSEKNVGSRLLNLEDAVTLLSCKSPLVPIWINVSCIEENENIFLLETSLRFRKPSLLRNADTGHAPFKAVD